MINKPQISIIVPVYNVESYIEKCIASLLGQSFRDIEIILVNDGSTDNSGAICDKFASEDQRVRVIHKNNGGVSTARNAGLDTAQGQYVMFCDSDDYVKENFCESLYETIQGSDSCLAFSGITVLSAKGNTNNLCPGYDEGECVCWSKQEFCDLYVKLNLTSPFLLLHVSCNKIFLRRIIEENHLRYDTTMAYNEDFVFNLNYLDKVDEVRLCNSPLYYYNVDVPGSLCKQYRKKLGEAFSKKMDTYEKVILNKATDKVSAHRVWCTLVFNDTHRVINSILSPHDTRTEKEKLKECNALIRSKRFRVALKDADTKGYNPLHVFLLRLGNYKLIYLLKKKSH